MQTLQRPGVILPFTKCMGMSRPHLHVRQLPYIVHQAAPCFLGLQYQPLGRNDVIG